MHPKSGVKPSPPRSDKAFVDSFFSYVLKQQENGRFKESLKVSNQLKSPDINLNDDDRWLEEEVMKRDKPLISNLSNTLSSSLRNQKDFVLSYSTEITQRMVEEVVRVSLIEPGGLATCRVRVDLVSRQPHPAPVDDKEQMFPTTTLFNFDVSGNGVVGTFEVQIYLFPSSSIFSWLKSFVTSLTTKKSEHAVNVRLLNDFILVKRKLFRSSSSNSLVIIKSAAESK